MTSPSKGLMFNIKPKRVSLVGQPATQREFLVTKNEETNGMDKIIELIKTTEAPDEQSLVDELKARGVEQDGIDAAVTLKRVLGAFADTLSEDDLMGIAKSVDFKVEVEKKEKEEATPATATEDGDKVEAKDNEEMTKLRKEVAQLKAQARLEELRKMAEDVKIGEKDEIIETLKNIDDAGGDVTKVLTLMKSASAAVEAAIGEEIGSTAAGNVEEGYDALKAEAERIASEEGITVYKAMQKLQDTRPDFVQKHRTTTK